MLTPRPRALALSFALTLGVLTQNLSAWNGPGHQTIAYLTWQNLSPEAKKGLSDLLRAHPHYAELFEHDAVPPGEQRDLEAFMVASTWPDLVRTPNTPRYKYHHGTWHYADFPFVVGDIHTSPEEPATTLPAPPASRPATPGAPATAPAPENLNAIQAFFKNKDTLYNPTLPPADRAISLCWVVHILSDIHQPLHASAMFSPDFPTGDKGGNDQTVRPFGQRTINLHSLWDGLLGYNDSFTAIQTTSDRILRKYARPDLQPFLDRKDFVQWMRDSYAVCVKSVYLEGRIPSVHTKALADNPDLVVPVLPPGYMSDAMNIAEQRAALAAYRLADTLNAMYPSATAPATRPTPK